VVLPPDASCIAAQKLSLSLVALIFSQKPVFLCYPLLLKSGMLLCEHSESLCEVFPFLQNPTSLPVFFFPSRDAC
jgi:hypothetical protein